MPRQTITPASQVPTNATSRDRATLARTAKREMTRCSTGHRVITHRCVIPSRHRHRVASTSSSERDYVAIRSAPQCQFTALRRTRVAGASPLSRSSDHQHEASTTKTRYEHDALAADQRWTQDALTTLQRRSYDFHTTARHRLAACPPRLRSEPRDARTDRSSELGQGLVGAIHPDRRQFVDR
jgi:hypothetical protein